MFPTAPIDELEAQLEVARADDQAALTEALNALAWNLRFRDSVRAHTLAKEAQALAEARGDILNRAHCARIMALTMVAEPLVLSEVFRLADEAIQLYDEAGDDYGRAGARDFLASILEFTCDFSRGLALALEALKIATDANLPVRRGYALSSVGGILAATGERGPATERLEEALALFEAEGDDNGTGTICTRLAKLHSELGDDTRALHFAERCMALAEASSNNYMLRDGLRVKAQVATRKGDFEAAEANLQRGISMVGPEPARELLIAELQLDLGRTLRAAGKLERAEAELQEALSCASGRAIALALEAKIHEELADLSEHLGRPDRVIHHLRAHHALQLQLAERESGNKLAQIEAQASVEAARKDAEIHRLRFVELSALQAKMVEVEKMALLGKLAAGTAHELNTPLGVLQSNAESVARAVDKLSELIPESKASAAARIQKVLEACQATTLTAVRRIESIAVDLGRFSDLDQPEQRAFDLRAGVESALAMVAPRCPSGVTVQADLTPLPLLHGWPRELNHAFLTVIENAVEATRGAGTVVVSTGIEQERAVVRVRDDGCGMSEDKVVHLFDVSWSGDRGRTEMRLGLAAAYAAVQRHGGHIEVQSKEGAGTTVTVRLPLTAH